MVGSCDLAQLVMHSTAAAVAAAAAAVVVVAGGHPSVAQQDQPHACADKGLLRDPQR
jgi:hypothetical protein